MAVHVGTTGWQYADWRGRFYLPAVAQSRWLEESGETRMIAGDPGHGERPSSTEVLNILVEGLCSERDELRATALVSDVRVADSDAVRVELERRDGQAIAVLLPYKKKRLCRGVHYGDLAAAPGEQRVWSP